MNILAGQITLKSRELIRNCPTLIGAASVLIVRGEWKGGAVLLSLLKCNKILQDHKAKEVGRSCQKVLESFPLKPFERILWLTHSEGPSAHSS